MKQYRSYILGSLIGFGFLLLWYAMSYAIDQHITPIEPEKFKVFAACFWGALFGAAVILLVHYYTDDKQRSNQHKMTRNIEAALLNQQLICLLIQKHQLEKLEQLWQAKPETTMVPHEVQTYFELNSIAHLISRHSQLMLTLYQHQWSFQTFMNQFNISSLARSSPQLIHLRHEAETHTQKAYQLLYHYCVENYTEHQFAKEPPKKN
jgi:hypothetical protein